MTAELDTVTMHADTVAQDGWLHKVLFRDWGDTPEDDSDGGYETGALIYGNMEAPTSAPFDAKLTGMFANPYVQEWFTLQPAGAVEIMPLSTSANIRSPGQRHWRKS